MPTPRATRAASSTAPARSSPRSIAPSGDGNEVTPGIAWLTIRSDHEDKYAQPDGAAARPRRAWRPHVGFDGPALHGAENVVIAGIDHRETAFSAQGVRRDVPLHRRPAADDAGDRSRGDASSSTASSAASASTTQQGDFATNLPLVGATVEVYATDAATGERLGVASVHRKTIGADGRWGPFRADGQARYEFVIAAPGYATTHVYRSPFPRSSSIVSLHPERLAEQPIARARR